MEQDFEEKIDAVSSRLAEKEKIYALALKMNRDAGTLKTLREDIQQLRLELGALISENS